MTATRDKTGMKVLHFGGSEVDKTSIFGFGARIVERTEFRL
jgi:hypothetical protein